ncbi:MAG: NAD(P)-dependent oxidoreductase [Phycisphaeraceae bacterium]|nr:NAD(P)-dependent oxidoreductase [Phycisphaeraceae bacterium]
MTTGLIQTVDELDDALSTPTEAVVKAMSELPGDLVVLGAAGKMGPTLCRMAQRALDAAGQGRHVVAVSRFSDAPMKNRMESWGIRTITGDLLDEAFVRGLPDATHVMYMAGMKFGATGNESLTWAMNALLPAAVCRRYATSRIAAFSTGNIYGLSPLSRGGSVETDAPNPVGEYAMSCLGRERVFEHFSREQGTPVSLLRLNYACELRYGVLVDLARKIMDGKPIDLSMGMANVIWQADANAMALLAMFHAASPPFVVNIAGPEQISIERACLALGERLGQTPVFTGQPGDKAILSNGQKAHQLFGYPRTSMATVMDQVAHWLQLGGQLLNKPTKFEVIDGKF